ncbi:uncharacterized protein LOC132937392 [Metopolophium dirhodum]|uniref:uncharacterized protein LOC132937390 n=1 Tax=Metopolophium dirhodum TaxID=44670 RepID=UPI0029900582|nr:uncharacterized protein LOC132937390 [Metopolophium dirhodum]XP_060860194.1 uncharacterized protein LOC132937392 [Metopolophium dirhodum]
MKTDTVNAKMKKEAWIIIQDEYNSQSIENLRTALILKNKYNNVKQVVKKHCADERVFRRGTGGGPTRLFPESSTATTVGEMLQTKMTGEPTVFDSDYVNDTWETNLMENENNDCFNDEQIITVNFEDPEESESVCTPHISAYLKSTPPLIATSTSAASGGMHFFNKLYIKTC